MLPTWVKGTLLLGVAFGAGVVSGVGYERRRTPAHQTAARDAHHLMSRFTHELGLDSAQHAAIARIIAHRQGTVDSTWHAMQPHVRATLDSTLEEITGVLRPDQVAKFRSLVEVMHPRSPR